MLTSIESDEEKEAETDNRAIKENRRTAEHVIPEVRERAKIKLSNTAGHLFKLRLEVAHTISR